VPAQDDISLSSAWHLRCFVSYLHIVETQDSTGDLKTVPTETTLSVVLEKGQILVDFRADNVQDAVLRLVVPLFVAEGFDPSSAKGALDCVMAREQVGSTTTGSVALPHGRLRGISRIFAGLGLNRGGIYGGSDGKPTVVLAFVTPGETPADHLRFLSAAAKIFRNEEAVKAMLDCNEPHAVLGVIRRVENQG